MQCLNRIIRKTDGRKASLGLAFREIGGAFLIPGDDPSGKENGSMNLRSLGYGHDPLLHHTGQRMKWLRQVVLARRPLSRRKFSVAGAKLMSFTQKPLRSAHSQNLVHP